MIRPVVALVKSLASAVAIGTGSSVGREGPIIQIGSALGSTLGQIVRMPAGQRIALVAAGAGAGIAATFNTPIGGVMFAIELMLPEVSVATFLPVAIATGAATFVGRWFIGDAARLPGAAAGRRWRPTPARVAAAAALRRAGRASPASAAAGFIRGLHLAEDVFDKIGSRYLRHILGMLLVGVLMYVLFLGFGQYLRRRRRLRDHRGDPDRPTWRSFWLLALLFVCKAAGDLAQPRLGLVGRHLLALAVHGRDAGRRRSRRCCNALGFAVPLSVPAFAMVGMGAMVGGGTGAVMTAVAMIFEMTLELRHHHADDRRRRDERRRAPDAVAREHLHAEAGAPRPARSPRRSTPTCSWCAAPREVMDPDVLVLPREASFDEFLRRARRTRAGCATWWSPTRAASSACIRVNTGLRRGLDGAHTGVTLGDVASRNFTIVGEDAVAFDVINRMWRKGAIMAVVVARPRRAARRGRGRRHHQGARRRFGRRQHRALSQQLTTGRPTAGAASGGSGTRAAAALVGAFPQGAARRDR